MNTERIRTHLSELARQYNTLPEADEPPPTMLQVLSRSRREAYWQRLFVHFLQEKQPHGLEQDVLEHLLTAFSERSDLDFSFSRLDLGDIEVEKEVSTSQGRPDVVIWAEEDWFLCLELKVDSPEDNDQTGRYVEVDKFDEIDLDKRAVPDDRHHYVYLAPEGTPGPDADAFVHVSWEWIASELQSFLANSYGEYPSRTTAQLNDFIDTIRTELTMTDYRKNQQEKVELAVEHYEEMIDVLDALEEHVATLNENWPDWFLERNPPSWDEEWTVRRPGNTYKGAYHEAWAIDRADEIKDSGFHVYWEFRVTERHLGRNHLEHRIVVTGQDEAFKQRFREELYSDPTKERLQDVLSELDAERGKETTFDSWDDHTYERIVDLDYEFEDANDFQATAVEAFEDLQPVFDLVTRSIPER